MSRSTKSSRRSRGPRPSASAADRRTGAPRLSLGKKLLFSSITLIAVFALLEIGLRAAGIGQPPTIGRLRFGYDAGIPRFDSDGIQREGEPFREMPLFEADPILYWKPIANTPFTGPEGFRGETPHAKAKGPDTYRIAVIGDSCSFLGVDLYPNQLASRIRADTSLDVEVINASCPGYSSFQGVYRLADVWPWQPDLLIVYFGWNDHWKSLNGQTDRELRQRQLLSEQAQSWLGKSRLFWSLHAIRIDLAPPVPINNAPVRVPPDDYRSNLLRILSEAEERDCDVVFVTAPSAFLEDRMPRWAYEFFADVYRMQPAQIADIPSTHRRYNEIVREVADSHPRGHLLDVAADWQTEQEKLPERFRGDRIHLTEAGHQQLAEQLYQLWKEEFANK